MAMSNVNPLHRYRMQYGTRRIYAEDVRAAPIILKPAHNPQRPYPYFIAKMRQEQGPIIAESTRNPRFIPDTPVFIRNEAFNSDTWWNSAMRDRRPWVTSVESPYLGWPRMTLEHGVNV